MMNQIEFEKTEVFEYLKSLQMYAYGDLELFHRLANEAELLEGNSGGQSHITASSQPQNPADLANNDPSNISNSPYPTGTNSSSTTSITTRISQGSMYSPVPTSQNFRATIPFTMMMLSCMEMLGYLAKENGVAGKTEKNIKHFFSLVGLNTSAHDIRFLVRTYRHGLVHNYFPKLNHAISYHSSNTLNTLFFNSPGYTTKSLNVNYLETCFRIGLERISLSTDLYENLDKQFTVLKNSYLSGVRPTDKKWYERIWECIWQR